MFVCNQVARAHFLACYDSLCLRYAISRPIKVKTIFDYLDYLDYLDCLENYGAYVH